MRYVAAHGERGGERGERRAGAMCALPPRAPCPLSRVRGEGVSVRLPPFERRRVEQLELRRPRELRSELLNLCQIRIVLRGILRSFERTRTDDAEPCRPGKGDGTFFHGAVDLVLDEEIA